MKKLLLLIPMLLLLNIITTAATIKDPVVVEAITKYKTIEEALKETKTILLGEKFITQELQKKSFTATRTTGAKADYYVADVAASEANGKIKISITFLKVGTGLLKLQKVADSVKKKLEE